MVGTPVSPGTSLADPGVRNYRTELLRKRALETSCGTARHKQATKRSAVVQSQSLIHSGRQVGRLGAGGLSSVKDRTNIGELMPRGGLIRPPPPEASPLRGTSRSLLSTPTPPVAVLRSGEILRHRRQPEADGSVAATHYRSGLTGTHPQISQSGSNLAARSL